MHLSSRSLARLPTPPPIFRTLVYLAHPVPLVCVRIARFWDFAPARKGDFGPNCTVLDTLPAANSTKTVRSGREQGAGAVRRCQNRAIRTQTGRGSRAEVPKPCDPDANRAREPCGGAKTVRSGREQGAGAVRRCQNRAIRTRSFVVFAALAKKPGGQNRRVVSAAHCRPGLAGALCHLLLGGVEGGAVEQVVDGLAVGEG